MDKKIIVNGKDEKEPLGDLYGIFFEDLNHAADGGLYAEMVQNRSFEFDTVDNKEYHPLYAWEKVERGDAGVVLSICTTDPYCDKNPHYLVLEAVKPGEGAGIANRGYNSGFAVKEGEAYLFSCYTKKLSEDPVELRVALEGQDGCEYAVLTLCAEDTGWRKQEGRLVSSRTDAAARLVLTLPQKGTLALDFVSLFPEDTFMGRRNGMRKDNALKIKDIKPKFMRFPGGCLVHDGSLDPEARNSMYRWKNTIGPAEERPARRNSWGYNQTLGLGFFEYFQFCEDIGAKPLPVLPGGYDPHHQRVVPIQEMQPWIQDALDLIEFANGSPETGWGAVRAQMGHEAPFGLEYLAIGNEEVGDAFFERYPLFHKAVRENYPEIKIIGTAGPFAAGSEYEKGWSCAKECGSDLVDEHYYHTPEWFLANHHRYDSFRAEDPKVFLGEYASWGNTWYNALVEASFMLGLERNAKAVGLACYAPMLANADYVNWKPDMIWFNNREVFGTPDYYVQKLFMNHQGSRRLGVRTQGLGEPERKEQPLRGSIRLQGYNAEVLYRSVTLENNRTGERKDFGDYHLKKGEVSVLPAETEWEDYTISCRAVELDGFQGFQIFFGWQDEENHYCWTVGGWQNYDLLLSKRVHGCVSDLTQSLIRVSGGQEYELKLQVSGHRLCAWVDGRLCAKTEDRPVVIEPLYYGASRDEADQALILKVANLREESIAVQLELEDMCGSVLRGTIYTMQADPAAENDFEQPERVAPKESPFHSKGGSFAYEFPGLSLTIFRLKEE